MSDFIAACLEGNIEKIKDCYEHNPEVVYERNLEGLNALGVAVLNGKWDLTMTLLRYCRVSPHAVDKNNESIYHTIVRGLKVRRPTLADFAEIREEHLAMWRSEEDRELRRINEVTRTHPELKPPVKLFVKKTEDLDRELFGRIELFLPKYLMNKYHVVLNRKNSLGLLPSDLAKEFDEAELADFYAEHVKPFMIKRRLIQGLNENLVRDIAGFL